MKCSSDMKKGGAVKSKMAKLKKDDAKMTKPSKKGEKMRGIGAATKGVKFMGPMA